MVAGRPSGAGTSAPAPGAPPRIRGRRWSRPGFKAATIAVAPERHEVPLVLQKNWQALIKPKQLSVEPGDDPSRVAVVVAEPLKRGFGLTLGNALRRVLLSSLQGAAITSVKIGGVLHEFSTIPGVMEDVADIVLNLKEVRLRMHGEGPKLMRVHQKGQSVLRA